MLSSSTLEYKEALGILAGSSQHITLIAQAIKEQILPRLVNRHSMIDVGAGMGVLTQYLQSDFKEITVLDINPEVEADLKSNNYDVKIVDFFEFETEKKYDFVLCSHVMYHFDKKQMKDFIDKLQSLVNPNGYCFIALIAPRGRNHQFHIKFNPEYVNSDQIIHILETEKVKFERILATPHHLITESKHEMRSLLKFFLVENCQTKPSSLLKAEEIQKINSAIKEEVKKSKIPESNRYDFEQEDDYIIIPRPS